MATKKKVGRPKKYNLDTNQVEQLAGFGCTDTEIASFLIYQDAHLNAIMTIILQKEEKVARLG